MLEVLMILGGVVVGGAGVAYRLAGKGQLRAAARAVILGGPGPWRPPQ